jgi:hypothetical protein
MVLYECYNCGYSSKDKSKMRSHLNNKNKCKSIRDDINLNCYKDLILHGITYKEYINNIKNKNKTKYKCIYCSNYYKTSQSLSNHKKKCINKLEADEADDSMHKLVDLLNEQLKEKDNIIDELRKDKLLYEQNKDNELQIKNKQIEELIKKAGIINHGIINNNSIVINNYSNTDISHITDKDIQESLKEWEHCIPKLIEKIHYNPEKPENYNIYISNLNKKNIMLYENNHWETNDREEILDNIVDKYRDLYQEYKIKWENQNKNLFSTYKRINNFLNHSDETDVPGLRKIKDNITNKLYTYRLK